MKPVVSAHGSIFAYGTNVFRMIILLVLPLAGFGLITGDDCPGGLISEIIKELGLTSVPPLNCDTESIDAATRTQDGKIFFFKDAYYWEVDGTSVPQCYPRLIAGDFKGGPESVDAALTWFDGKTYLFKGDKFWSFTGRTLDPGYPMNIKDKLCEVPTDIDAALLYEGNKAFFFKGSKYWRLVPDETCDSPAGSYPKSINEYWEDMPFSPDATVDGGDKRYYFIKDGNYYPYSEKENITNAGTPIKLDSKFGLPCQELASRISPGLIPTVVKTVGQLG